MKIIINSPKYGKQIVLIDKEDAHLISRGLSLSKAGAFLYVRIKPNKRYLHRTVTNAPSNMVVDHINRNTLDNRKDNLRIVTIQGNLRNQKRPNNKTGTTGVSVHIEDGKMRGYQASIKINYKKIYLGFFKKLEDAIKVRREAEKKYYV